MKKIIYTRPDGCLCVIHPAEGARLAYFVTLADGTRLPSAAPFVARPVDSILRRWPIAGATAEWAESVGQFIARIRAKDVPADALNVRIVDAADIPADRTFRDAWKDDGAAVCCDMPKARALHRERIRRERKPRFEKFDGEWMKCTASGDALGATAAEVKRQLLRDAPAYPAIDAATTADELKAAVPPILQETL